MACPQYAFHVIKKYKVGNRAASTHYDFVCLHPSHEICGKTPGSLDHKTMQQKNR
jgi:hypothetical protein